jgi:hypothetical protein
LASGYKTLCKSRVQLSAISKNEELTADGFRRPAAC